MVDKNSKNRVVKGNKSAESKSSVGSVSTSSSFKKRSKNILKWVLFIIVLCLVFSSYYITSHFHYDENIRLNKKVNIFGFDVDLKESSLLIASVVIGFVDGFNPCAMWVLIYLITLVASLNDRKKMYYIVGTFVTTEAIMYFFVLAGWLKLFEIIGFSKFVMYGVGGFALWFGLYSVYDYIKKKGVITCEVGDLESRKKTMNKIRTLATAPVTVASVLGTMALAIAVNSIEFICSAGLPAVFTQMLAISSVSTFMKYVYILIYDFFFMIDDFIIFGLALFAINSPFLEKYSGISKILGGIIMIVIGVVLLFFPNLLI